MMKFLSGCIVAIANIFLTFVLIYILSALVKLLYYTCLAGWRAF